MCRNLGRWRRHEACERSAPLLRRILVLASLLAACGPRAAGGGPTPDTPMAVPLQTDGISEEGRREVALRFAPAQRLLPVLASSPRPDALQVLVGELLADVQRAMASICRVRCGVVVAVP